MTYEHHATSSGYRKEAHSRAGVIPWALSGSLDSRYARPFQPSERLISSVQRFEPAASARDHASTPSHN